MKKVIIAITAVMFLMSCGGGTAETVTTDSTSVVDSTVVDSSLTASDSTVSEIDGGEQPRISPIK